MRLSDHVVMATGFATLFVFSSVAIPSVATGIDAAVSQSAEESRISADQDAAEQDAAEQDAAEQDAAAQVVEKRSIEAQDDEVVVSARSWGPEQATGEPNTKQAGDIATAWASATEDGQIEWLELEFDKSVTPMMIVIHETYNPGAVNRIVTYTETGMIYELWAGKDPVEVKDGWGIAEIPVEPVMAISKIRIYLDSENVAGWNEIDAVGIKDADEEMHWAVKASASSTYADGGFGGIGRRDLGGGIFE